jgi:type II secretory pathway predicted ATPase ExeA
MEARKLMTADPILAQALRQWGLRDIPFSDTPGHTPFLTPAWEQALRQLHQTAALRSLMLLCGDNGVGKSALAAHWLASLEPKAYLPLAITQASLSATGLMAVLLHKLGQPACLYRNRNLACLEKALHELGRITPVLVLDESQNYPPGALEEIRLLLGLNLTRQPTFALVLIGDPYLQDTLRLQHYRALYSRIASCCQLPVLERAQVEPYLVHGFRQAGLERPCLAPAAIELLAGASGGVARQLNLLARAAWLEAALASANTIGPEQVRKALDLVPAARDRINP